MLTKSIKLKSFRTSKFKTNIKKILNKLLNEDSELLKSMSDNYTDNFVKKKIKKISEKNNIRIIGMGGSILGSQAIYNFFQDKIKKNFFFVNNLDSIKKDKKEKITNLIISKSGNTLETISNANILIKKKDKNIFITQNRPSYLLNLANDLKAEVVHHNNFIGGRFSVLSEVGMLPANLMGLNPKKFRQFNNLIKNKNFLNLLIKNTNSILFFSKKKYNSIILNYDYKSDYLFQWYQQLVAESLGKKKKEFYLSFQQCPKTIIVLCNYTLMV